MMSPAIPATPTPETGPMHLIVVDSPDGTVAARCGRLPGPTTVHRAGTLPELTDLLGRVRVDMVVAVEVDGLDVGTALMIARLKQPSANRVAVGHTPRSKLVDLAHRVLPPVPSPTQLQAVVAALSQQGLAVPAALADVIGGVASIPSVAALLAQLRAVLADDRRGVDDVADVIGQDPGLAAKVLHLANAGFVARRSRVVDLDQAASMLGMRTLREIVLASAAFSAAEHAGADPALVHVAQRHGTAAARALHDRPGIPAHAATAALLMDVGLPLMAITWPEEHAILRDFCLATGTRLVEEERRRMGVTHADAGSLLARRWSLPHVIADQIAGHHFLPRDDQEDPRTLGLLAHLAAQRGDPADRDPWEPDLGEDLPGWLRVQLRDAVDASRT